jgi:hypothetical protein
MVNRCNTTDLEKENLCQTESCEHKIKPLSKAIYVILILGVCILLRVLNQVLGVSV